MKSKVMRTLKPKIQSKEVCRNSKVKSTLLIQAIKALRGYLKSGMMVLACNASIWKAAARGPHSLRPA